MEYNGRVLEVNEYLSLDELKTIVNGALEIKDFVDRDAYIYTMVLALATDITEEEVDSLDINFAVSTGLVDYITEQIKNYKLIDFYLNKYESLAYKLEVLVNEFDKKLDSMPDLDELAKQIEMIKG